jgi:hypothetical protein
MANAKAEHVELFEFQVHRGVSRTGDDTGAIDIPFCQLPI